MNQPINQDFNNKINLYKNVNIQVEAQRKNYKMIKEYYKNKSNMVNYLKSKVCTDFMENFEILNYISSGSSGVVYEGRYLKKPEKHVCLKFLLNKSEEEKREKKNKSINININTNTNIYPKIKEINIQNKLKDKNITEYYNGICKIWRFGIFSKKTYKKK